MYDAVIQKIQELGATLPPIAGRIEDIGIKKQFLTEKDVEIEMALASLVRTFPGEHSVYAEELNEEYLEADNVWIIDPISNTFNFLHGLPHYAVSLAHAKGGEVVFACVYDPSMDELFTAEKGKGTFLNGAQVRVSDTESEFTILGSTSIVPGRGGMSETMADLIAEIRNEEIGFLRIFGSLAVHYAYVACGRADVAVSLNKDTFPEFAGKLLIEEAGGRMTDFDGRELATDSKTILATNGKKHAELLQAFKKFA